MTAGESTPAAIHTRLKQGMQLQVDGQLEAARVVYESVVADAPGNPDGLHLLGLVLCEQNRDRDGAELIERAIAIKDDAAPFHHNLAGVWRRLGRLADAEREFRRAIALKPDYGEAYQGLAEMVTFAPGDPLLAGIHDQLDGGALSPRLQMYFHFAAGKINDDIGRHADAFRHFEAGNRLAQKAFDSADFRQQVKNTLYVYSQAHVKDVAGAGHPAELPVFVVGMPRSGTSLVEQILASHSEVWGAGELNDLKFAVQKTAALAAADAPWPLSVPHLRRRHYRELGELYLDRVQGLAPAGTARIVDKHPLNFQFVGLILDLFPNARVIHTVRDPLDTCLSCFFQNFTRGQHYSFNLEQLAHFYVDYRRVMEHWNTVYPGRILEVCYEQLLDAQERETRRLLAFCGLGFEPACLAFHETDRVVRTASFLQVRKPLYQSSRGRWRRYATQLRGVADIIGVPIEDPVTVLGTTNLLSRPG